MDYNSQIVHCNYAEHFNPTSICIICRRFAENMHHTDLAGASLTPELFATAALFLASGESAFISGHNLVLDTTTRKANFWGILMRDSTI
jgi:hypothetical protein